MPIQLVFTGLVDVPLPWRADWAWGLRLIVLTVLIHIVGLAMTREVLLRVFSRSSQQHRDVLFVIVTGMATFLATCLHAIEAFIWALAYALLGAIPSYRMAVLYSLNAMTRYGNSAGRKETLARWLWPGPVSQFRTHPFPRRPAIGGLRLPAQHFGPPGRTSARTCISHTPLHSFPF